MKPVILVGSLAVAAAAGAAACYLLIEKPRPFNTGPGNGAITCPGSAACPDEAKADGTRDDRGFQGLAFPKGAVSNGIIRVCDGSQGQSVCPPGFRGLMVKHAAVPKVLKTCTAGNAPCRPDFDAVYCVNSEAPKAPATACAVLPELSDPNYEP